MAKAPPKSLRITQGLCIWTAISTYVGKTHTHGRTRDPGYDLHVPWEREEEERRVYTTTVVCWKREWIGSGGKKSVCLGAADGHVVDGRDRSRLKGT